MMGGLTRRVKGSRRKMEGSSQKKGEVVRNKGLRGQEKKTLKSRLVGGDERNREGFGKKGGVSKKSWGFKKRWAPHT